MSSVTSNSVPSSVDYPFPSGFSLDSLHSNSSGIDMPSSQLLSRIGQLSGPRIPLRPFAPKDGSLTTSNAPFNTGLNNPSSSQSHMADIEQGPDSANRTYSFVALPGNAVKKIQPRRRYDEIDTRHILDAHMRLQKHGPMRSPSEFEELHKQWVRSYLVGGPARRGDKTRFNDLNMYDPACSGGIPSPNAQYDTSHNGSNSNGIAKTLSNWSN
ncbi:hypothetical protein M378DRAFT_16515 [Amanita muscaria Koide BX008]|uniref:Uncharacterized protein n=1 Tax=Amanita muscaria (strain Koide BX008) TaxID=946122 RepID=A0A0C2WLH4_AMAMK|nr:hypothetical protein M378DRAFT_16515 [Amanita muscaria Koide BX008]